MNAIDINGLLSQMRAAAAQAAGQTQSVGCVTATPSGPAPVGDFASLLRQSMESVNDLQHTAHNLSAAFERGAPNVDLSDVMVASQKATVSFQAMTQTRNKVVSAYQEVMGMQV